MKALFDKIEKLSDAFGDPEYLHLLLEPVFIYGVGFGLLIYLLSACFKDSRLQLVALIVMAASALVILPYLSHRAAASDRITRIYQIDEPTRAAGFVANSEAWTDHRWVYLLLAGVAATAVFVGPKRNRLGMGLAIASVLIGSWVIILSTWMHYQEAVVHHPNLKTNESPVRERVEAASATTSRSTPEPEVRSTTASTPAASDSDTPVRRNLRPLNTAGNQPTP